MSASLQLKTRRGRRLSLPTPVSPLPRRPRPPFRATRTPYQIPHGQSEFQRGRREKTNCLAVNSKAVHCVFFARGNDERPAEKVSRAEGGRRSAGGESLLDTLTILNTLYSKTLHALSTGLTFALKANIRSTCRPRPRAFGAARQERASQAEPARVPRRWPTCDGEARARA